jgi:glyoxylase I family protein
VPITGIDHVVIRARDLGRMTAFYRDALGCAVVWERPELGLVHLSAGASLIDLVDVAGPLGGGTAPSEAGRNMDHLCLRAEPFEAESIAARVLAAGGRAEPAKRRYGAEGFGLSIYLADPEGNRIEIKGPSEPGSRRRPAEG